MAREFTVDGETWKLESYEYLRLGKSARTGYSFIRHMRVVDPVGRRWDYQAWGSVSKVAREIKHSAWPACDGSAELVVAEKRKAGYKRLASFMGEPSSDNTWKKAVETIRRSDPTPLWIVEKVKDVTGAP